jgi:hypothetical protein
MRELLEVFTSVMLVPGNHEFYRSSFEDTIARGRNLEETLGSRFSFMHRKHVSVDDGRKTVLGCTLHSYIPTEAIKAIKLTNDFAQIAGWTRAHNNTEHTKDCVWLQATLADIDSEPSERSARVIIATDYPPTFEATSHPHSDPDFKYCFASDTLIDAKLWPDFPRMEWWVSGYTHYDYFYQLDSGLKLLSNQPNDGDCKRLYDIGTSIWPPMSLCVTDPKLPRCHECYRGNLEHCTEDFDGDLREISIAEEVYRSSWRVGGNEKQGFASARCLSSAPQLPTIAFRKPLPSLPCLIRDVHHNYEPRPYGDRFAVWLTTRIRDRRRPV